MNKLNQFICTHKDPLKNTEKTHVVYKIDYFNCDMSYVGQTKRQLYTRIKKQRAHISRDVTQSSPIMNHRVDFNHDFDWENVKIVDIEKHYLKRLISEVIHIKKQDNGINLQSDTQLLHIIYFPLLHTLFRKT